MFSSNLLEIHCKDEHAAKMEGGEIRQFVKCAKIVKTFRHYDIYF